MEFLCKCSFLEIYNEHIYDLLDHTSVSPLVIRESIKHGVFVDRLIEKTVSNVKESLQVDMLSYVHLILFIYFS